MDHAYSKQPCIKLFPLCNDFYVSIIKNHWGMRQALHLIKRFFYGRWHNITFYKLLCALDIKYFFKKKINKMKRNKKNSPLILQEFDSLIKKVFCCEWTCLRKLWALQDHWALFDFVDWLCQEHAVYKYDKYINTFCHLLICMLHAFQL